MTWILLVTWIVPGQPPQTSSYQTQFSSQQTCATARDEVLKSALRMRQEMWAEAGNDEMMRQALTLRYQWAGTSLLRYGAQPPNRPPCAMMAPFALASDT
jgi:hypothetical protein